MGESISPSALRAMQIGCKPLSGAASHCSDAVLCAVARAIWPDKTAIHWAAACGVQERMARYWLAGAYSVSDSGRRAIVRFIA